MGAEAKHKDSPGQTGDKAGSGGPQLPAAGALVEREAPAKENGAAGDGQRARETPRVATLAEGGALPSDPASERAYTCTRCGCTHAYPVLSQPDEIPCGCESDVNRRSIRLTPTVPVLG